MVSSKHVTEVLEQCGCTEQQIADALKQYDADPQHIDVTTGLKYSLPKISNDDDHGDDDVDDDNDENATMTTTFIRKLFNAIWSENCQNPSYPRDFSVVRDFDAVNPKH